MPFLEWRHLFSYQDTQLGAEMPFSGRMEAPSQLQGILSLGLRALPMRCVRTWSDVSAEPFRCSVFAHGRMQVQNPSDAVCSHMVGYKC